MKNIIDKKLLKFILVGILNTLVGTVIMFGLYNLADCSYWVSSAANYVIGSILSYVLNKKFTFRHRGRIAQSALRFTGNIAACYLLAYGIAKPVVRAILTDATQQVQENIAMLAGMILFTGFNYLGQRYFVFGEKNEEKTSNRSQV